MSIWRDHGTFPTMSVLCGKKKKRLEKSEIKTKLKCHKRHQNGNDLSSLSFALLALEIRMACSNI